MTIRLLVVDDKRDLAEGVALTLSELSEDIRVAHSGEAALAAMAERPCDLVLTDVRMPGMDGMSLLSTLRERFPRTHVILLTAYGTVSAAVEAMQLGAFHYLLKPFDTHELLSVVRRALDRLRERDELLRVRDELEQGKSFLGIVARSAGMLAVIETIRKAASSQTTVLIAGESGTGKELVARALHHASPRCNGPFVAFSAAALPDTLAEAELFGSRRGAYTGAERDRKGLFLEADGGTLFIDEVSSMPQTLQGKLLRAIQEREVLPVGASTPVKVDVRIVAATNIEPRLLLSDGILRKDLYYRLAVVRVHLPPLRERIEDIPLLADLLVARVCGDDAARRLAPSTLRMLCAHDWPGNVRELQNVIEHASVMSEGAEITPADILLDDAGAPAGRPEEQMRYEEAKRLVIERFQRRYLERLLDETEHNLSAAARKAGLTRAALHRILRRLGVASREASDAS